MMRCRCRLRVIGAGMDKARDVSLDTVWGMRWPGMACCGPSLWGTMFQWAGLDGYHGMGGGRVRAEAGRRAGLVLSERARQHRVVETRGNDEPVMSRMSREDIGDTCRYGLG